LVGNLGADPIERAKATDSGPVVKFNVAENVQTYEAETRTFKTVHTNWFTVTAFGPLAERVRAGLKKGDRVAVHGRMKATQYQDKNGEDRFGFEIIADQVALWQSLPNAAGQRGTQAESSASEDARPAIRPKTARKIAAAEENLPF
ncbi:MAG TPA: single-stranded DNA-binding protein, partial [Bdellovibrionota bacterium]|nr:single-stranded DNA-binding protein [Bdellovibrionota bacterium]